MYSVDDILFVLVRYNKVGGKRDEKKKKNNDFGAMGA